MAYTHFPFCSPPRASGSVSSVCLPQRSASTDAFSFGCSALITDQWQRSRNKQYELIPIVLAKSTPPAAVVPQTMSSLYLNCVRNCRITVYRWPISSIRFISVSLRQLLATILLVCKAKWSRTMKAIVSEFCGGTQRFPAQGSIDSASMDMEQPISSR